MGLRRLACAIHLVLIAVLSLLPVWLFPPSLSRVPGIDKWVHVAMYGLLGALLRWAAGPGDGPPPGRWLPVAAVGYGLLMEFFQLVFSGGARSFSWGDAVANGVGAILFWFWTGKVLQQRKMTGA
jgi:VanZ family protein